jgi:hypothetical protein
MAAGMAMLTNLIPGCECNPTPRGLKEADGGGEAAMTATDKAVAEALGGGKGAPPKADSLATLLSQALIAEDRSLVERCLNVSDQTTVGAGTGWHSPRYFAVKTPTDEGGQYGMYKPI